MSGESNMDHINYKRIKLEENYERLKCFDATRRNSVVDCFKNKSMEFYTNQLDDKSVRACNTIINTGKNLFNFLIVDLFYFSFL